MDLIRFTLYIFITYAYIDLNTCENTVKVNKCCEQKEIFFGDFCTNVNETEQFKPLFTSETSDSNVQVNYKFVIGKPDCGHLERRAVYQSQNSVEQLTLFPNGVLRHYYEHHGLLHHDYDPGKYCLEKKIYESNQSLFAWVCMPNINDEWMTSTEFLMHNIINPVGHSVTIICLLITAIIYFVMPTLCDLTGNIITTICMCLIISETADMIRLLTVFKNHTSLFITEAICYVTLLAAFLWLNSLGYYIWKTFRSRNVFLLITDGKKYCYHCGFVWSCTLVMGALAIFAHFTMDYPEFGEPIRSFDEQEQIGSLGLIIFFAPVAFAILTDVFFFATTLQRINRMHTYGRIHHKLRHSFRMFLLLLLVMALSWVFFLASFLNYEGLINSHIIVSGFKGPLILYICIFNQKHVLYLIRKSCCYDNCIFPCCRPDTEYEWGDEMTAMNTELNY
ncbi:hypothetical protein NQ317_004567 [Molorchus minor]|uniref:G-protein coupled receptors family 2 profile 2 domain-containing protein n=1 Tax=Molorchus minor TaxID=1323400 RepID=A0ABQ9JZX9_9CUCU|nr:hypothetical protein NQ317_004567 [Molorchus minor]